MQDKQGSTRVCVQYSRVLMGSTHVCVRCVICTQVSAAFSGRLNILVNNVGTNIRKTAVEYSAQVGENSRHICRHEELGRCCMVPHSSSAYTTLRTPHACIPSYILAGMMSLVGDVWCDAP